MNGDELLRRNWSDEDRLVIQRLLDSVGANKFFITKQLMNDIQEAINLCIRLKDSVDGPIPDSDVIGPGDVVIEEDSSGKKKYFGIF